MPTEIVGIPNSVCTDCLFGADAIAGVDEVRETSESGGALAACHHPLGLERFPGRCRVADAGAVLRYLWHLVPSGVHKLTGAEFASMHPGSEAAVIVSWGWQIPARALVVGLESDGISNIRGAWLPAMG
jgi:hypothetical protein